jgi:GT2 family glycosyltransferase
MVGPAVSVLIPTYNRAHLLGRAIDSVLNQSYPNCHVVIVDDGSTDGTRELVAGRYGDTHRVRYVHQENRGAPAARNAALAIATGEYFAFLDSDDLWRSWKLEVQIGCLERLRGEGASLSWTDIDIVDGEGTVTRPRCSRSYYGAYKKVRVEEIFAHSRRLEQIVPGLAEPGPGTDVFWGDVYSRMALGNLSLLSTIVLSRECARAVGQFDESMVTGDDYDYALRACAEGSAVFVDAAAVAYRLGTSDQLTGGPYELTIATNALRSIERAFAKDHLRLQIPPAVMNEKIAHLHAWIGELMLDRERGSEARAHFFTSLRHRPAQPRVLGMFVAASTPPSLAKGLRGSYRRLKSMVSRQSDRRAP